STILMRKGSMMVRMFAPHGVVHGIDHRRTATRKRTEERGVPETIPTPRTRGVPQHAYAWPFAGDCATRRSAQATSSNISTFADGISCPAYHASRTCKVDDQLFGFLWLFRHFRVSSPVECVRASGVESLSQTS